jgi:hypothetical protein
MSHPSTPTPVKLLVSHISGDAQLITGVAEELSKAYGKIDYMSACIPFTATTYYQAEMGEGLMRRLITFENLLDPERLPEVKRYTDKLEARYTSSEGNRRINLDPGYMTLYQLILATNKRFAHRPYLRDGVYADLTLIYREKSFQPLAWTFPDYGSAEMIGILNRLRERYYLQLKEQEADIH